MRRFIVAAKDIDKEHAYLRDHELHHARDVLRLTPGERLIVVDGRGGEYLASIEKYERDALICKILSKLARECENQFKLALAQSLPKGDKMAAIVEKATELGVWRIIPFRSERTVVKLDHVAAEKKVQRWRGVAMAASKQCGRSWFPEIEGIKDFKELCDENRGSDALKVLLWEEGRGCGLKKLLEQNPEVKQALLVIGPEGGFSRGEAEIALDSGFNIAWLGPLLLRSETAAISAAAIFQYTYGGHG